MKGYIYQLVCPLKKEPFYVGSTTQSLSLRLHGHIYAAKTKNTPVARYIRDNNIVPSIQLLFVHPISTSISLRKSEAWWIKKLTEQNFCLLNKNAAFAKKGVCSVRIKSSVMEKVRDFIKDKPITISSFFEKAALEKIRVDSIKPYPEL